MTGGQVRGALKARNLTHMDMARIVGIPPSSLSGMLRGDFPISPERKALIERAISQMGLAEPPASSAYEPIFDVPTDETSKQ
jgi:hypothetical protein